VFTPVFGSFPRRVERSTKGKAVQISTNQFALFSGMESEGLIRRSRNRAAWWRQDLDRTAVYLMGQARTEDQRSFVEQLYEQAVEEGPDFINYRSKSAFEAAPRLGIDRNAYARILNALDMIERGTARRASRASHAPWRGFANAY
jgi:hypothetical protein